jgi:lycopene beta-cyclase
VITSEDKSDFDVIYDSRPPVADTNILLQHFRGLEIRAAKPVFNPEVAILMDFRVSQENGIHFMYVLGYDEYTALVESTFFSLSPHPDKNLRNCY